MKKIAWKLATSIAIFFGSFPAMRLNGWLGLGVVVGLMLCILYWIDLGRALRGTPNPAKTIRNLGLLMGLPQAIFGACTAFIGLGIAAWVIHNSLWHRDAHYNGGFLTFGISPVLILTGFALIADSFKRAHRHEA